MSAWLWVVLAVVASGVTLAVSRGWVDFSDKSRRSGSGSALFGAIDEVFAPTRHEAQIERDRQTVLPAPAPVAGDGDWGLSATGRGYTGRVRLEVPREN